MRRLSLLLTLAPLLVFAAEPAPKPVDTLDELRPLAEKATVAAIEFNLQAKKNESALWDRFANKPEETQFAVVTAREWKAKWRLLVEVLVTKAEQQKLSGAELRTCLSALNMGLTAETAPQTIPASIGQITAKGQTAAPDSNPPEPAKASTANSDGGYGEPADTGSDATIPVGCYFARSSLGPCWIIVCKWEDSVPELTLSHIRIWAVDCATHKVIGFTGCD